MNQDYLDKLNPEQRDAATTVGGYVKILAGAGTGKTKTLVARTAYLLEQPEVQPENILLITFTKKAAKEMRDRIKAFLGDDRADRITALTFHSLAAEILRKYAPMSDLDSNFDILSAGDAEHLMKLCHGPKREALYNTLKLEKEKEFYKRGFEASAVKKLLKDVTLDGYPTVKNLLDMKSMSVNYLIPLNDAVSKVFRASEDTDKPLDTQYIDDAIEIIQEYEDYKHEHNYLDYDDLLYELYYLLSKNGSLRNKLDMQFRYIMCDEYQDTNIIQDKIIDLLSEDVSNVCVVGDDNQSIYAFRGAVISNIITFEARHKDCKVISLIRNYRSTQEILDVSNAMMKYRKEGQEKILQGFDQDDNPVHGDRPVLVDFSSPDDEAKYIVNQVRILKAQGLPNKEIAVLARAGRQTYAVEKELNLAKIPFKKFGGLGFFNLKSVDMILSLIKASRSIQNDIAWLKALTLVPGIGLVNSQKIYAGIKTEGTGYVKRPEIMKRSYGQELASFADQIDAAKKISEPTSLVAYFAKVYNAGMNKVIANRNTTDDKKREAYGELHEDMKNIKILEEMALPYTGVQKMLDDLILNKPSKDEEEDFITVSTIHSVKGLEFTAVFFVDPIMGVIPHVEEDTQDTREDLRCCYVALTRAKRLLMVTYAKWSMGNPAVLSCHLDKPDILALFDIRHKATEFYNPYQQGYYRNW